MRTRTRAIIYNVVSQQLLPQLPAADLPQAVCFYGAGCMPPFSQSVLSVLQEVLGCEAEVESDLLGAARALCGEEPGIACILGTGTNSCHYDGHTIVRQTPPLGYILGDEGSGAYLGKILLGDLFKGFLPEALRADFMSTYRMQVPDVIDRVYRQPAANTFLASLVPFIAKHREEPAIHALLTNAFRLFLQRNIASYRQPQLPIHFVGGVAFQFSDELQEAILLEAMTMGHILRRPIEKMTEYHIARDS